MVSFLKEIESFETITIFRHQSADPDAMGSQFGLKLFLEQYYPEKTIYALGHDVGSCAVMFPSIDDVEDQVIATSCAIILDTANRERIDDQRYQLAKKTIKIDHHIVVDEFADISIVDTTAAATCEILAYMIEESKVAISEQCAKYLYLGLLADTISFTTISTTPRTLRTAAFLVSCGLNVSKINQERSGISLIDYKYVNAIRNRVELRSNVAFAIMQAEDYESLGMSYNQAKEKVFAMANVKEFEIYCLFTEDRSYGSGYYNGSLRSKNIAINQIANRYQGGGHANACGVKKLSKDDIYRLISDFENLLYEQKNK